MTRFYFFFCFFFPFFEAIFSVTLGQINCQAVYLRPDDRPHTCVYWQWPAKQLYREISTEFRLPNIYQPKNITSSPRNLSNGSSEISRLEICALLWNFDLVLSSRLCLVECFRVIVQFFEQFSEKEGISSKIKYIIKREMNQIQFILNFYYTHQRMISIHRNKSIFILIFISIIFIAYTDLK